MKWYVKKCGAHIPENVTVCNRCGWLQGEPVPAFMQNTSIGSLQNEVGKNQAVASMVLGIITVSLPVLSVCIGQGVGIIFGFIFLAASIVGLVMASSAKKKGYVGGMATAGNVLNIIGLIISAIMIILGVVLWGIIGFAFLVSGVDAFGGFENSL